MSCWISTVGCTIGVKEDVRIVYVSLEKHEGLEKAGIRIATSDKIPVTVETEEGTHATELGLGGMYVITARDLKSFLEIVKKYYEITPTE